MIFARNPILKKNDIQKKSSMDKTNNVDVTRSVKNIFRASEYIVWAFQWIKRKRTVFQVKYQLDNLNFVSIAYYFDTRLSTLMILIYFLNMFILSLIHIILLLHFLLNLKMYLYVNGQFLKCRNTKCFMDRQEFQLLPPFFKRSVIFSLSQ